MLPVVVLHAGVEYSLEVVAISDPEPVETLAGDRSGEALGVRVGACGADQDANAPDRLMRKTSSKAPATFASRSRIKQRDERRSTARHQEQVSGLLCDPVAVRVCP